VLSPKLFCCTLNLSRSANNRFDMGVCAGAYSAYTLPESRDNDFRKVLIRCTQPGDAPSLPQSGARRRTMWNTCRNRIDRAK
jgi:hypothetical protein